MQTLPDAPWIVEIQLWGTDAWTREKEGVEGDEEDFPDDDG